MTNPSLAGLLPYQLDWINDQSTVKVYEKSRRIGITWSTACEAVLEASRQEGQTTWYSGYNHEMALEFIEQCTEWAKRFNEAVTSEVVTAEDERPVTGGIFNENKDALAYTLRFASGHKIAALSSRPTNFRGKGGVAIIDEAAFHDDLPGMMKAALAFTVWNGRVVIISTHNGAESEFARLIAEIHAGKRPYSLHRCTLDDALAQGLYRVICRTTSREWSAEAEQTWRQQLIDEYGPDADEELFCVAARGGGTFLPVELIESRMSDEIPVLRWDCKTDITAGADALWREAQEWIDYQLYPAIDSHVAQRFTSCFGEDFGRSGDLTVIWPLQIDFEAKRQTPFTIELRNVPFKQQAQILHALVDRLPNFLGGCMDARGNGQYLAEDAAIRYGKYDPKDGRLSGINQVMLTEAWYREAMPKLKAGFEQKRIDLPRDAGVLADLRMLRMERGVARVPETRAVVAGGARHGDSAIALALAWHASNFQATQYYGYRTPWDSYNALTREQKEDLMDQPGGWKFARTGLARWKGAV